MRSYSIGELERLLDEKAHVIRYWEEEIPQLAPRRSVSGRREYSEPEALAFLRVKYLVRRRGLTPAAARERLLLEASGPRQELRAMAFEIRSLLVRAYFLSASRRLPEESWDFPQSSTHYGDLSPGTMNVELRTPERRFLSDPAERAPEPSSPPLSP